MEEGTKNKRTVFIGGLGDKINEDALVQTFSTFGDIVDAQIPADLARDNVTQTYRGIAFLTFSTALDAQDAIDNMDMNEYDGRVLRVNIARAVKGPAALGGGLGDRAIWESEDWLKANEKSESGGPPAAEPEEAAANGGEDDAMDE